MNLFRLQSTCLCGEHHECRFIFRYILWSIPPYSCVDFDSAVPNRSHLGCLMGLLPTQPTLDNFMLVLPPMILLFTNSLEPKNFYHTLAGSQFYHMCFTFWPGLLIWWGIIWMPCSPTGDRSQEKDDCRVKWTMMAHDRRHMARSLDDPPDQRFSRQWSLG